MESNLKNETSKSVINEQALISNKWWDRLTTMQKEWLIGNNYLDDEVTQERIIELQKKDLSNSAKHAVDPNG